MLIRRKLEEQRPPELDEYTKQSDHLAEWLKEEHAVLRQLCDSLFAWPVEMKSVWVRGPW